MADLTVMVRRIRQCEGSGHWGPYMKHLLTGTKMGSKLLEHSVTAVWVLRQDITCPLGVTGRTILSVD